MKIIIAGSRTITDFGIVEEAIFEFLVTNNITLSQITEIVSGKARGVDTLGEQFAHKYGISIKDFPADWNKFGKSAGFKRNAEMGRYADQLIAVTIGSPGTKHMITFMESAGKGVFVKHI